MRSAVGGEAHSIGPIVAIDLALGDALPLGIVQARETVVAGRDQPPRAVEVGTVSVDFAVVIARQFAPEIGSIQDAHPQPRHEHRRQALAVGRECQVIDDVVESGAAPD